MNTQKAWKVANRLDDRGNPCGIDVQTGDRIICRIPDGCGIGWKSNHSRRMERDANLIAAAPELLEALEALVDHFGSEADEVGLPGFKVMGRAKEVLARL